jgi:GT2 family glycosyltransferase
MTTLQRVLFPTIDLCPQVKLYVKLTGGSWWSQARREVHLKRGSVVRFDTYFNGFSVGKWRRHTAVNHVSFGFEAQGELDAELVLNHPFQASRVVAAASFQSDTRAWFELEPPPLEELGDGQLFLKIRGVGKEAVVFGGRITTSEPRLRDVRLGVVITTYNRPQYVERNLNRMASALKESPDYGDRLEILVVDNARNLDLSLPATAPITILPNRNLGGAGGFARGLIRFREVGEASHILFMDDDISFEPEVLFRTLELLSYAQDPLLCVAGAMLTEEDQYIQFESGAEFLTESVFPIRAIGRKVDLRYWRNLVANDVERSAGYGAWWYFAFPLGLTTANPLPVFFRGDDVCFGLMHAGKHAITLNGIGVWHQDFGQKNFAPAFFYEARNFPLVSMLASDRFSAIHLVRRFVYHTIRHLLALKYESAAANIEGIKQFLEGPEAWMGIDHEGLNSQVRARFAEQPAPLDRSFLRLRTFRPRSRLVTKGGGLVSALFLSGHLVPARLNRRPPVVLEAGAWSPSGVFGREQVVYRYDPTGEGYVARRDRKRFFGLLGEMVRTAARVPGRFDQLKAQYRAAYPTLTSDEYWRRQFEEPSQSA